MINNNKKIEAEKIYTFVDEKLKYILFLGVHEGLSSNKKKPLALQRDHSAIQDFSPFSFVVGHFCLSGSDSETQMNLDPIRIWIQIHCALQIDYCDVLDSIRRLPLNRFHKALHTYIRED